MVQQSRSRAVRECRTRKAVYEAGRAIGQNQSKDRYLLQYGHEKAPITYHKEYSALVNCKAPEKSQG